MNYSQIIQIVQQPTQENEEMAKVRNYEISTAK